MTLSRNISVLLAGIGFAVCQAVAISFEFYFLALLPVVLGVIWTALFRMDVLLMFIVMSVPASINLESLEIGGVGFYLPTEPLLFGVLVIFIFKLLLGNSIDKRILVHPISFVIYLMLGWIFLTSITSEFPVVSFKFLLARMWFVAGFYFLMVHLFKKFNNFRLISMLYLFPLFIIIIYTVVRHAGYGFDKTAGHWVMEPFFKDHTAYGAVLAMYFPVLVSLIIQRKVNPLLRVFLILGFIVLTTGIVLSYTRAAWVSLVVAGGLFALMLLRIKLRTLIIAFVGIASFVWIAQDDLLISLERNDQDSSDDLAEHVESISNVSSDASNLERLNRWECALAMFEERPLVGWGPGTYQFVYAPFQRSNSLTIISTNNADGGNAHSEYLGPLAEQGVPGTVIFLILILAVSSLAFRLAYTLPSYELKSIVFSSYLGWVTYIIHGVLNNYLDTDKASMPFWSFIAALVAIDIFYREDAISKQSAQ